MCLLTMYYYYYFIIYACLFIIIIIITMCISLFIIFLIIYVALLLLGCYYMLCHLIIFVLFSGQVWCTGVGAELSSTLLPCWITSWTVQPRKLPKRNCLFCTLSSQTSRLRPVLHRISPRQMSQPRQLIAPKRQRSPPRQLVVQSPMHSWFVCLFVCWSLTSLCHSNGHIETMPAREINPFTALTRIRS